ncbi:MAG: endonuclease III [Thermacetogeniaceae bacterium]
MDRMKNSLEGKKMLAKEVLLRLKSVYPEAGPLLRYSNPYQALVAVMLSAQTTDEQVNKVTPELFSRYPDIASLAQADIEELKEIIRPVGLHQAKAAHLVAAAKLIMERYNGEIPETLEELLTLPGVGRKTANVLLAAAFGKPGLGVDTHVHRVANRLGLATAKDPAGTEKQLKEIIPEQEWGKAHYLMIFHGRRTCRAQKADCKSCILADLCSHHQSNS